MSTAAVEQPQHTQALALANRIRLGMSAHRREIHGRGAAGGMRLAADLLTEPDEIAARMTVEYLLHSIPRMGRRRAQRVGMLLGGNGVLRRQVGPLDEGAAKKGRPRPLTARQRATLAATLRRLAARSRA